MVEVKKKKLKTEILCYSRTPGSGSSRGSFVSADRRLQVSQLPSWGSSLSLNISGS